MASAGLALHHQQNAQVVVAVLVRRIQMQPHAKGLLCGIKILHGDVGVANVVVRLHGIGSNLEGLLESLKRARVIVLIRLDDAQQVIALNAGRMVLESFQCCRLCFCNSALLRQHCGFRKVVRRLGWDLLRHADDAGIQRERQKKRKRQARHSAW